MLGRKTRLTEFGFLRKYRLKHIEGEVFLGHRLNVTIIGKTGISGETSRNGLNLILTGSGDVKLIP
jgi:hypothetical protein